MVSPAKAHFLRRSAASAATESPAQTQTTGNAYELMLHKLAEDRRRLKDVQSIERKADVKRELLPEYLPWIEGVIKGNSGHQDDVFTTIMVWLIDVGDIVGALPLARYAIAHRLTLPDQYKRTTGCLIAEEAADMALRDIANANIEALTEVADLTDDQDMPDEVRAKLHKAIGYAARHAAGDDTSEVGNNFRRGALDHLKRAFELHDKVGVKKDIERLETLIKNSAGTEKGTG